MKIRVVHFESKKITVQVQGVKDFVRWSLPEDVDISFEPLNLGDFLALAFFPFAMKKSLNLDLDYPVSPMLLRNLAVLSTFWCQWRPELFSKPVKISTKNIYSFDNQFSSSNPAICAFSGGVDSTYAFLNTLYDEGDSEPNIKSAIMVNGFGYDLDLKENFDKQYLVNSKFCSDYNVNLFAVTTNWSKVLGWYPIFHSFGLASILALFSKTHKFGIIGLDYTFLEENDLLGWGNMFLVDHLLSAENFTITPKGYDKSRVEKIDYLAKLNKIDHIAVCNKFGTLGLNCGECDKCLRTMLMFMANDISHEHLFKVNFNFLKFSKIKIKKNTQYVFYKSLLDSDLPADVLYEIKSKIEDFKIDNARRFFSV